MLLLVISGIKLNLMEYMTGAAWFETGNNVNLSWILHNLGFWLQVFLSKGLDLNLSQGCSSTLIQFVMLIQSFPLSAPQMTFIMVDQCVPEVASHKNPLQKLHINSLLKNGVFVALSSVSKEELYYQTLETPQSKHTIKAEVSYTLSFSSCYSVCFYYLDYW